MNYIVLAKIGGRPYEGVFDTLAKAEKKRDLLIKINEQACEENPEKELSPFSWLILEDDGTNTREIAGSQPLTV